MIGEWLKPPLRPLWQRVRRKPSSSRPIWSGIYSSFDDVPVLGSGFSGRRFAEQTQQDTRSRLEVVRTNEQNAAICQNSLLPLLVSIVGERTGKARILDFGGGTGAAFVDVLTSVPSWLEIKFDVVETAIACELGEELFAGESRIKFYPALPEAAEQFDIVHISSALQYVSDYRRTLGELCGFKAPFFLLANLAAAAIPTYATAQHVYDDMVVPYWFLNVDEVIDILATESYRLLWKSSLERTYDQSEFPPEYRLGRACNLLFHRID